MKKNVIVLLIMSLAACSGEKQLDDRLRQLIQQQHLNQPFVADFAPQSQALAELGGQLFFSPDLSLDGSVSCASCHHPDQGGADGIALPIGIGGVDSRHVGEQRIDVARKAMPDLDLQGLIPRNTPTVINASLFRQNLFWDGRVQYREGKYGDKKQVLAGMGAAQSNPSNYLQENLLQTQARMPMTSTFEMKGGLAPNRNNHEIEQEILHFLQMNRVWCEAFSAVFGEQPCHELVTLNNLTRALAEFQATLVLTDSPFQRYVEGDSKALSRQQKRGAIAFLSSKHDGGAGCVACHSGKTFSNEKFYNINIPPSGQGANDGGWDLGRNNVDKSEERFSFRVPILLNVAETAPYFHNGVALTLEDAIRHKQTAADVDKPASRIALDHVDYAAVRDAIQAAFDMSPSKALLPERLSEQQIADIAAFLRGLTDDCLQDAGCRQTLTRDVVESPRQRVARRVPDKKPRIATAAQPPQLDCSLANKPRDSADKAGFYFSRHSLDIGLDHQRSMGLVRKGWMIDVVNYASVSAQDLDGDCLDDLVFDAGANGLVLYRQQQDGRFQRQAIAYQPKEGAVNALVMDVDGDYRYDLFVGNYGQGPAALVFDFQNRSDDVLELHGLTGPVINASIGDINADGRQDLVFALWRSFNSLKQQHIWLNDGHGNLREANAFIALHHDQRHMGGGNPHGEDRFIRQEHDNLGAPDFTFTPNFVDVNNNGRQDLLVSADFFRSQVLANQGGHYADISDKTIIDDSNGMGAAIGDFNNNGLPDWYVTSINDAANPMWDGHRLYINQGDGRFQQQALAQKDVDWGWGACAADFNNDGHLDIFYVSGYGEPLPTARYEDAAQQKASEDFLLSMQRFSRPVPTLLINDGNGGFVNQSLDYGLDEPLPARGIACFDYQQDGDIDIVVAPLEGPPVLLRNNLDGARNWMAVRLLGLPGNSEALGSKVKMYDKNGMQYREVRFENNYISRNPAQQHFGLADLPSVEKVVIELPAPDARTITIDKPAINRLHVIDLSNAVSPP